MRENPRSGERHHTWENTAERGDERRHATEPLERCGRHPYAAGRQFPIIPAFPSGGIDHSRRHRRGRTHALATGTTLNIQSFMGAIMAIGVAVANAILLVTFAERSRVKGLKIMGGSNRRRTEPSASDPDDQFRDAGGNGADGARPGRRRRPKRPAWAGGDRRSPRRNLRPLIILPSILATLQSRHARISASLDPDDPHSPYFEPSPRLATSRMPATDARNAIHHAAE